MANVHNGTLTIRLFGEIELSKGANVLPRFPTRKSTALFSALVLNSGRIFHRDTLAEMFWGDLSIEKAKGCLRTDLWRIRNMLGLKEVSSEHYLLINKNSIGFNNEASYELDVEQFEKKVTNLLKRPPQELTNEESKILQESINLYRGDLLETCQDDWCVLQRESLRIKYLSALELLMRYYQCHGALDYAIEYGQKLLSHDPLLEHIHLELMHCYCMKGNRLAAIRQYILCRNLLREELGVSPMGEVEQAYRAILTMSQHLNDKPVVNGNVATQKIYSSVLHNIDTALTNIKSAENLLADINRLLNK